ncbi:MAG: glucosaminidase domain-containing protein [Sulfurimonas sp.]
MKIFLTLLLYSLLLFAGDNTKAESASATLKKKPLSVAAKKRAFFQKIVPVIEKVYKERYREYEVVKKALLEHKDAKKIALLKQYYGVRSDRELLCALKPHPVSIAIAQAAMESAWGTSRFFKEANNIFGVWSTSSKQKRIAAGSKRGKQTIWLRKFNSLEAAVRNYYFMLSSKKAYRKFKALNCDDKNSVYKIVEGLLPYSERKEAYVREIANIIRHNKLTRYDTQVAKKNL